MILRRVFVMPNDAKLGLVTGLIAVTLIAILFFRRDPASVIAPAAETAPTPGQRAPNSADIPGLPAAPNPS